MDNRIIEPRRISRKEIIRLAARPDMDGLRAGKIVFYNNGKLDACNYIHVFVRLKELFVEKGISNFQDFKESPRGKTPQHMIDYAKNVLAADKPAAAIVAIGDMGVSTSTTILVKALEEAGVPTVYLTADPGTGLAKAAAFYRAGQLCMTDLKINQMSTVEDVNAEVERNFQEIVDALTLDEENIGKRAELGFAVDENISNDGYFRGQENDDHDLEHVINSFHEERITDGLPIIPPTVERYEKMLEYCPYKDEDVIVKGIGPTGNDIRVRDIAVAAVMAGCKPIYMPVLITAFKALGNKKYTFTQSITTSHLGGDLVIVSGPIAKEIGMYGGQGFMGPGFVANATIGRAINLVVTNVCRSVPGVSDLGVMGSPAEYTYCFMEDKQFTPWDTINEEKYDEETTTVTVLKAEPPHGMIDFLSKTGKDLLDTITDSCTTLGSNNAYITGSLVVVLSQIHAEILAKDGYTKDMIRDYIHKNACNHCSTVKGRGLDPVRPEEFNSKELIPVTKSPEHIEVVVGGGTGPQSAVILPWGLFNETVTEAVVLPDGKKALSVKDFRKLPVAGNLSG